MLQEKKVYKKKFPENNSPLTVPYDFLLLPKEMGGSLIDT